MSPITTIVFFFTLFFVAFAAPIDTTGANLAKRSYTGRVRLVADVSLP